MSTVVDKKFHILFIDEVHLLGGAKHLTDLLKPSVKFRSKSADGG